MVRKKLIFLALLLAVLLAVPTTASAASVYPDGNISTTYLTYFEDIASGLSPFDDYVFCRTGQYSYQMFVGDLTEINGNFSADGEVKVYTMEQTQSGYNAIYEYDVSTESGFFLSAGNILVYSNLGDYPTLTESGDLYAFSAVLLLVLGICLYLLRSLFGFCLRIRH